MRRGPCRWAGDGGGPVPPLLPVGSPTMRLSLPLLPLLPPTAACKGWRRGCMFCHHGSTAVRCKWHKEARADQEKE